MGDDETFKQRAVNKVAAKKAKMSRCEKELAKEINFLQNYIESTEIHPNEKTEILGNLEAMKQEQE